MVVLILGTNKESSLSVMYIAFIFAKGKLSWN